MWNSGTKKGEDTHFFASCVKLPIAVTGGKFLESQEPGYFPEFLSSILIFTSPVAYAFGEAVMASVMMVLPSSTFFSSIGLAAGTCGVTFQN